MPLLVRSITAGQGREGLSMKSTRLFLILSILVSTFSLVAAFASASLWVGAGEALLLCIFWLVSWKWRVVYLIHICFLAVIVLVAAGILQGLPFAWLLLALGFTLAVWDLLLFQVAFSSETAVPQTTSFEKAHLKSLWGVIALGLLFVFPLHLLQIQLPFIAMFLLVLLCGAGLGYIWNLLVKRKTHLP